MKLKVKDLINQLKGCDQEKLVFIASDEELNSIFTQGELCVLEDGNYCLFGFSGTELEEDF